MTATTKGSATFGGVVLAVRDMAASRRFYEELLGQRLRFYFGENIGFESGLSLHLKAHFAGLAGIDPALVETPLSAGELYFEVDEIEAFAAALSAARPAVRIEQPCFEQAWGQRVIRFRDPDGHLIEAGEPMAAVARRCARQGMSAAEVARRTQLPLEGVRAILGRGTGEGEKDDKGGIDA